SGCRVKRAERQLSSVAATVARSVRTGAPLVEALADAASTTAVPGSPLAEDLEAIVGSVRRGASVDDALARWASTRADPAVRLFVAACRFGHEQGGDLAAALDGAAVSLLDQDELADEARALASQARTSAGVLVALPVLGAAGFSILDPRVARTLVGTGAGRACLVLGVALD